MDARLTALTRQYLSTQDIELLFRIRRLYRTIAEPLPNSLLIPYVTAAMSYDPEFRAKVRRLIENLFNDNGNIIPERFEGQDASDGYYYKGWDGDFHTNQPLLIKKGYSWLGVPADDDPLRVAAEYRYFFQWAHICEDSVPPDLPLTPRSFSMHGGAQFGPLPALCQEIQQSLRQATQCDQWTVDWWHGQDVNESLIELDDDEWQIRAEGWEEGEEPLKTPHEQWLYELSGQHVIHVATTHGFFLRALHPVNQHIVQLIEETPL
jgi:hypothetical protein